MPFPPDARELHALADRISGQAAAARARALGLASCMAAVDWRGVAASGFALEAQAVLAGLRAGAGRLDAAADLLHQHARRVAGVGAALGGVGSAGLPSLETVALDGRRLFDGRPGLDAAPGLGGG